MPVGISLAAPLERVHTFTLRGQSGIDTLATGVDLVTTDPRRFEAELTTVQLGAIAVDSPSATAYRAVRTRRRLAADGLDVVHFCLLRLGRGEVEQDGRAAEQQTGSAMILRSVTPFRSRVTPFPENAPRSHVVMATVPMAALPDRAASVAELTCVVLPKTALLVAATNFLSTVALGLPRPGSTTANFVEHAIVDLVLAVIAEQTAESLLPESVEAGTRVRIRDFVLRRLPEPSSARNALPRSSGSAPDICIDYSNPRTCRLARSFAGSASRRRPPNCLTQH